MLETRVAGDRVWRDKTEAAQELNLLTFQPVLWLERLRH